MSVKAWLKKKIETLRETKIVYKQTIVKLQYVPLIVAFKDVDGQDYDVRNDITYGKNDLEKTIALSNAKFEKENNPELFKAFDTLKECGLDVTFFVDKKLFHD